MYETTFFLQGGIVMPNSGSCSTRQVGVNMDYSEQLTRDYPSFSQVKTKIYCFLIYYKSDL